MERVNQDIFERYQLEIQDEYKEKLNRLLEKYVFVRLKRDVNYYQINKNIIKGNVEGSVEWSEIYRTLILECPFSLSKIERTRSGGIKILKGIRFRYDIQFTNSSIELTYIGPIGMARFIFNGRPEGVSGSQSFREFQKMCEKEGICLDDYAISNGKEVKETIEKPMIDFYGSIDRVYTNVHHMDLNSSFMAGIAEFEPALAPVINTIYMDRKKPGLSEANKKLYKDILTHTYGFMQSRWCKLKANGTTKGYALAHMSKAALAFNNRRIEGMIEELTKAGRTVLATNTDGIWYKGDLYHPKDEGVLLGQWKNDYTKCMIRFKSKGAYEFIGLDDKGKRGYKPVVRGRTRLDSLKDRDKWQWGDIYLNEACTVIKFFFDEKRGIVPEYVNIDEEEIKL